MLARIVVHIGVLDKWRAKIFQITNFFQMCLAFLETRYVFMFGVPLFVGVLGAGGGGVGSWNVVIGGDSFLMGCGDNFEKLLYTFIHLTLCSIKHSTENTINKIVAKANVIIAYLFQLRTVSIRETRNVRKFTKRRKKNFVHIRLRIIYEIV